MHVLRRYMPALDTDARSEARDARSDGRPNNKASAPPNGNPVVHDKPDKPTPGTEHTTAIVSNGPTTGLLHRLV